MGVTITIENNRQWSREHGAVKFEEYGCDECEWAGKVTPDCRECGGDGVVKFEILPYEMHLANGNFSLLWNSLGLEFDYCGAIDARIVLDALRIADPELMIRGEKIDGTPGKATIINCGTSPDQIDRYLSELAKIANEAARREEMIVWG